MKEYKRQFRNLKPETKEKISKAMKGTKKTDEVRKRISSSLKEYWKSVTWEGENNGGTN